MISILVQGADAVAKGLAAAGQTTDVKASRAVAKHAQLLVGRIRSRAPVRTGHYRRSWNVQVGSRGGGPAATVGTNAPQARRLELGFVGADSLGRHYNQAPRPHVRPAIQESEPAFLAEMQAIARTASG